LTRLSSISDQTASLTEQIRAMEAQRLALREELGRRTGQALPEPSATGGGQPPLPPPPAAGAITLPAAPAVPPPAAEPGSLREGFLGMLDSLDGRLQGLESRLAQLEANQLEQQQQWQAVRKELLEIRAGFEERLVRQRLKTVEAQAAEVEARMQLKNTREQLEQSAQQSSRLDARLGQRDIDNRELQQRTIALEEERDQLQRGLRATQSRLDSLRTQLRAIGGVTPGSE
jgi:hypothetical protein